MIFYLLEGSSFLDLIYNSGILAKIVLLILLIFSILSWSIIFRKIFLFRRVEKANDLFLEIFRRSKKLSEVYKSVDICQESPLTGVFYAGYREINAQLSLGADGKSPKIRNISLVERSLRKSSLTEITALEKSLSWLATTASASPFIGLFGTVVGIINAFEGLGKLESTSIQAVAPGIAEALVATAFGLFAAIPAVIFYNHFLSKIKYISSLLDDFTTELLNLIERSLT